MMVDDFCKLRDVKTVNIAGLVITSFASMKQAVNYILNEGDVRNEFAVAINAEKVVSALEDSSTMHLLQSATLRYADGASIVLAMRRKSLVSIRIPGCDLWRELLTSSANHKVPVYVVGATDTVNRDTVSKLHSMGVNVVGSHNGFFSDFQFVINDIIEAKPRIISVAMGSPFQELFIQKCRESYPDAFYMGVGGTYDVFVGNVKRAPVIFQKLNLEWFYRLIKQPSRIFRQRKIFKFLLLYLNRKV
ncbi:WecB/TagA/CpsF family glycosyltransferase [Shewanella indica]|uniref:WecB/TagA/CpsF family glycosyltransferase n=1 Tax=Shewanella indica TaxID=768528 RepID=UPI001F2F17CF|nr:WecB/TagA/CpsF family glycosyltransferase [Shewanella indica]MCE9793826.1 WecB/TagA/CpsF family glycosyltransferase [Shewanella indica]